VCVGFVDVRCICNTVSLLLPTKHTHAHKLTHSHTYLLTHIHIDSHLPTHHTHTHTQSKYILDAVETVISNRALLAWTYVHMFYLTSRASAEAVKLFAMHQVELEHFTDQLHEGMGVCSVCSVCNMGSV
jgi:hypothetical protein